MINQLLDVKIKDDPEVVSNEIRFTVNVSGTVGNPIYNLPVSITKSFVEAVSDLDLEQFIYNNRWTVECFIGDLIKDLIKDQRFNTQARIIIGDSEVPVYLDS